MLYGRASCVQNAQSLPPTRRQLASARAKLDKRLARDMPPTLIPGSTICGRSAGIGFPLLHNGCRSWHCTLGSYKSKICARFPSYPRCIECSEQTSNYPHFPIDCAVRANRGQVEALLLGQPVGKRVNGQCNPIPTHRRPLAASSKSGADGPPTAPRHTVTTGVHRALRRHPRSTYPARSRLSG